MISVWREVRPVRPILASSFVNSLGTGMWLASGSLYAVLVLDLQPTQVATALTVAGLVGTAAGPLLGRVADLTSPRNITVAVLTVEGLLSLAYLVTSSLWLYGAVSTLVVAAERAGSAVRAGLIGTLVHGEQRVAVRAASRSATNAGIAVGSAAAGQLLLSSDPTILRWSVVANSASFLAAAALTARLPQVSGGAVRAQEGRPPASHSSRTGPRPVQDVRYLGVTALFVGLFVHASLLFVALPLWLRAHHPNLLWLVSAALVVNTVGVVLLQVRLSRGASDVTLAARMGVRGAVALAVSFGILSALTRTGTTVTVAGILAAVVVYTVGEVLVSASGFGLSFGLAREEATSEYQGLFGFASGGALALSPTVVVACALFDGPQGWAVLAVVTVLCGLALPLAVRGRLQVTTEPRATPTGSRGDHA